MVPHRWSEGARPVSGRLSPICKIFGVLAKMRQASYKSNAKNNLPHSPRPHSPTSSYRRKAGIQRGGGRGVLLPIRIPYSPSHGRFAKPFRPEPVEGPPSRVISAAARNPRPASVPPTLTRAPCPNVADLATIPAWKHRPTTPYQPIDVQRAHRGIRCAKFSVPQATARLRPAGAGIVFARKNGFVAAMCHGPYGNHYKTIAIAATEQRAFFRAKLPCHRQRSARPAGAGIVFARKMVL